MQQTETRFTQKTIEIPVTGIQLKAQLTIPGLARGVVVFAHGFGSTCFSRRNQLVAAKLQNEGIGTLLLDDGTQVQGFVCEAQALAAATDITHLGGWRAYVASLAKPVT